MDPRRILEQLPSLKVLVVGDLCLDRWCHYDPQQAIASRETGIPRIAVVRTECTPGAAGTVANNLLALGAGSVSLLSVIGEDGNGHDLTAALSARGADHHLLVRASGFQTFTYTKLLNAESGQEDLPRVDLINLAPPPARAQDLLLSRLHGACEAADVILVSDQSETETGGVVTPAVRQELAIAASRGGRVFWVDSRRRIEHFRGMVLKPNEDEAAEACERTGTADYGALREFAGAPLLVVTHGGNGVSLADAAGLRRVATRAVENPVDICGAGDSFSAGAALALAVTGSPEAAVRFGHLVASVTIMKKGTGTASPREVLHQDEQFQYAGH
jgi:rfaE bifunctional protein kinase chain/domain